MSDKEVRIPSGSKPASNFPPIEVYEVGLPGLPGEIIIHNGRLFVYGSNGATLIDGGIIQTDAILANSITTDKLTIGSLTFTHNLTWTAVDEDTASWSSGTIKLSSGETKAINSGNTGNITATTFIYFDNTSTLKTTTDYEEVVGEAVLLLAIVEEGDAGGKCVITPLRSSGTTISGDKIVTGRVQSTDEKTYFDLNEGRIIVNDDTSDIILIGKKT